jgi:hypothetical protein
MSVSGATSLPLISNAQTVAASASLNSAQGTLTSPGNQLVAQLQQPLPLQVSKLHSPSCRNTDFVRLKIKCSSFSVHKIMFDHF